MDATAVPAASPAANVELIEGGRRMFGWLRRFHDHSIEGVEHLPRTGGALLVFNHSLATYDTFMLATALYEQTGRLATGLGDDLIFRMPWLKRLAREAGIMPASPDNGLQMLRDGHLVGVAPGGMREALRPSSERYSVRWDRRRGFIRLAIRAGAPLVLAACPAADDMFTVYENRLTKVAYIRWRVPVPLIRGWRPTLVPRPVELVHYLAPPIWPPEYDELRFEQQVDALHAEVVGQMERMLRGQGGRPYAPALRPPADG